MFQNYLNTSIRYLLKNRTYAAINILGLSIGIAACLLLFRLVQYELSFNSCFKNNDRIVRVVTRTFSQAEGEGFDSGTPIPAIDAIQSTVPQFSGFARVHIHWPTITVPDRPGSKLGKKFLTDDLKEVATFAEPGFFQVFDFKWVEGDASVLNRPESIVMSRRWAEKCFGSCAAALGKTVVMDNLLLLTVAAVVEDPAVNSDLPISLFVSYEALKKNANAYNYRPEWGSTSSNDQAFGLLASTGQLAAADAIVRKVGLSEYKSHRNDGEKTHYLQALSDMHFDNRFSNIGTHQITRERLGVLSAIALLILAMACFNFINLATAQAAGRAREVGVRKTLGGSRGQLIGQFLGETSVIVLISVCTGTLLALLGLPLLKLISDVPDNWPFLSNPIVPVFLVALTVLVSLLSGFYPALVLAGFNPARALKNSITARTIGGVPLRKALVVTQFIIAHALIVGALVVVSQMEFIRKKDLGFSPNLVYTVSGIPTDSSGIARMDYFKQQLLQIPAVESVSLGNDAPSSSNTWGSNFGYGRGANDAPFSTNLKFVDVDYFKTYHLRLVAGRGMEPSDTLREVVVNQTMLRKLGVTDPTTAIDQELRIGGRRGLKIVGVVEDFNQHSMRDPIEPMTISTRKEFYQMAGIKIRPGNMNATVSAIEKVFDTSFPEQIFVGKYFDERIAEFYRDEDRFSALCKGFALLAVLISCLGLFGLAAHTAAQRTKEIGVRKVLGASITGIVGLLAKDFLKLILIAIVVASPLAWYLMREWLNDFAYRIDLKLWMFLAAGTLAALVAACTISFQSIKAALMDPVKSLRSE